MIMVIIMSFIGTQDKENRAEFDVVFNICFHLKIEISLIFSIQTGLLKRN